MPVYNRHSPCQGQIETYKDIASSIKIVNNPIKEEDSDNRRFLKDVENWIEHPIELAVNDKYPSCSTVDVWNDKRFMSSIHGAVCTTELKKRATQRWQVNNPYDWLVLGFTFEEKSRANRFKLYEKPNLLTPLIDKEISKKDCFEIITKAGIKPPRIYSLGFPKANCIGCVKATSPSYWNHVRKHFPEVFEERAKQSRELNARLARVKGKRIFLDELKPTDTGRPLKNFTTECSVFCET